MDWEHFYQNYRRPNYLPGYEVLTKLGSGAFGEVYKIRKLSIGKFYAVKFLRVEDSSLRTAVLKELESVKLLAQIDHPNLVSIEDQGEVDGIPYIVMSYAGERTLRALLNDEGPIAIERTLDLFRQICAGVQALHDRSIIHFDLKPANVYLKGELARVGDYGLSKLISRTRRSLSFGRGTPYYMAPEMLKRRGDQFSDVYSLGIILFEMLTGEVPFRGDTEWEVLKQHETADVSFPDDFPADLEGPIRRALHKEPEERFESVNAMRQAVLAAAPTTRSAPPRPAKQPPAKPARPMPAGRAVHRGAAGATNAVRGAVQSVLKIPAVLIAGALQLGVFFLMIAIFFIVLHLLFKLLRLLLWFI